MEKLTRTPEDIIREHQETYHDPENPILHQNCPLDSGVYYICDACGLDSRIDNFTSGGDPNYCLRCGDPVEEREEVSNG